MPGQPALALLAALLAGVLMPAAGVAAAASRPRPPASHTELVLDHGRVRAIHDPFLPAPGRDFPSPAPGRHHAPARPTPARRGSGGASTARRGHTVSGALLGLQQSMAISAGAGAQYLSQYIAARRSLGRLRGTRRIELAAVLANLQAIAGANGLTPSRLAALFLTLDRNRQWWTTGPLLSNGDRVGFPGSRLVWQYYAGQGIEVQWLGTFGKANGYFQSGHDNGNLRALLDEAIPLATQRAGGIAWEYLFQFDGGQPPWTSGLSQGTAIQALSRGWSRLHDQGYLTAARQALGIFETPPPQGVRVTTPTGAHYLEYSYAPGERILNGFIQSLVGLYDFATLTGDALGQQLFASGDAEARAEVPEYDTGAWSLYDQSSESDLSYHELLRDFLRNLCQRTQQNPLISPLGPPGGTPPATTGDSGGQGAGTGGATAASSPRQTPGGAANPDVVYCQTATRFTSYEKVKPTLALITSRLRGGRTAPVRFSLSKISNVAVILRRGGRVAFSAGALEGHGSPGILWSVPRPAGVYDVTLEAVDLAGNRATAGGTVTVLAAPRPRHPRTKAGP